MEKYLYVVMVDAETRELADIVIAERLDHDEGYVDDEGVEFDYQIEHKHLVSSDERILDG